MKADNFTEYEEIKTSINETIKELQIKLHSLNLLNSQPDQIINNIKLSDSEFNCIQVALDSYLYEIGDLLLESNSALNNPDEIQEKQDQEEIYNCIKNTITKLKKTNKE